METNKGCLSYIRGWFSGFFSVALIAGIILAFTNPSQADVVQEIKNREGPISLINVRERVNCLVFSLYRVEVSSLNQGLFTEKQYLGILGQVRER